MTQDFSIPRLVRLFEAKLDEWLLMTAEAPGGFVRALTPTTLQIGVVREDRPNQMRIITAQADVTPDEMNGIEASGSDLAFGTLFENMMDEIELQWSKER
jgi:hypothetical protein